MKRFRGRLSAIAFILILAVASCGMSLFALADGETNGAVDAGGWNTTVAGGGDRVTHEYTEDGFSKYTGIQNKDTITRAVPIRSDKSAGLICTMPYRFDISVVGEGSVSWKIKVKKDPDSDALTSVYGGKLTVGGAAFTALAGDIIKVQNVPTYSSGDVFSMVFNGHHEYSGGVDGGFQYLNDQGQFVWIGNLEGKGMNDVIAANYEEFYLTVTAESDGIESISVKAGEGLILYKLASPDFDNKFLGGDSNHYLQNIKGVFQTAKSDAKVVFKGFGSSFNLFNWPGEELKPYVSIGEVRLDADGKFVPPNEAQYWGYYNVKPALDATSALMKIELVDITVTYNYGEDGVFKTYLKSGEKAYTHYDLPIEGKIITGWTLNGEDYDFNTPVTGDITLTAKTADAVTVNFMDGTTRLSFKSVASGSTVSKPNNPVKAGATFAGWFKDEACTEEFDFNAPITEDINVYAGFAWNVSFRVIGYNGTNQVLSVNKTSGSKISAEDFPTFGEITGWPEFANIQLKWYTDAAMTSELNIPDDGIEVSGSATYYAAALDKSAQVAMSDYMNYEIENGWDTNGNGIPDANGHSVNRNDDMRYGNDVQYGPNSSFAFTSNDDGSAEFKLWYIGYIVNAHRLDVSKDIYFSYTLKDTSATNTPEAEAADRWFMFGLFNSYASALSNQAQMHENNYGVLAGLQYKFLERQFNHNEAKVLNNNGTYHNNLTVKDKTEINLIIRIGETADNSGIWQIPAEGDPVRIATLNVTRSMFPNGAYFSMQVFREAEVTAKLSQTATVTKKADDYASTLNFTIPQDAKSGDKIYFTAEAPQGMTFAPEKSLFADDNLLKVRSDDNGYFFNLPLNANEISVKYGYNVRFMQGSEEIGASLVFAGEKLSAFETPRPVAPTGHVFAGWFTNAEFTSEFDFDNAINEVTTLYAKFEPREFVLQIRDGGIKIGEVKGIYGGKFAPPATEPVKEGYTFAGYFADRDCTFAFDWDATVTDGSVVYVKFEAVKAAEDEGCGCGGEITATSAMAAAILLIAASAVVIKRKQTNK